MLIFPVELEMSGVAVQSIHQAAKNGSFCKELLSENDFEAVLAAFSCYEYGANTSDADQKITADQKQYFKCSSCVIIC